MTWWVACKCGNLVECAERHDFSVLPCPSCRQRKQNVITFCAAIILLIEVIIASVILFILEVGQ